jgi:hypothetical protein
MIISKRQHACRLLIVLYRGHFKPSWGVDFEICRAGLRLHTLKVAEGFETASITYLKNNLSAHGGVVKRFKMLTYYVYAPLFHHFAPCPEP